VGLGVAAVQELHAGGELRACALEHEVVVVAHQAEGVQAPAEPLDRLPEQAEEEAAIVVVQVDQRTRDPAAADVVDPIRKQRRGRRAISSRR
jgi:hypothetical protein